MIYHVCLLVTSYKKYRDGEDSEDGWSSGSYLYNEKCSLGESTPGGMHENGFTAEN